MNKEVITPVVAVPSMECLMENEATPEVKEINLQEYKIVRKIIKMLLLFLFG